MRIFSRSAPQKSSFWLRPFFAKAPFSLSRERIEELPPKKSYRVTKELFSPQKEEWLLLAQKALAAVQKGPLQKVVVPYKKAFLLSSPIDPFAAAANFSSLPGELFCIETPEGGFFGLSPERVLSRTGLEVSTEALAGTRKRGKTPEEDLALEKELTLSPKEQKEWSIVAHSLQDRLRPLSQMPPWVDPQTIRKTPFVQHLQGNVNTLLHPHVTEDLLVAALHPSPALSGFPVPLALEWLQTHLAWDRGWYGATLGWRTDTSSEWIACIRSAHAIGNELHLFAGVGIVPESDPDREWEELQEKLQMWSLCMHGH